MPKMRIKGIGLVAVTRRPKRIPAKIKIGGSWFKVDKEMFKFLWASEHATKASRKKFKTTIFKSL